MPPDHSFDVALDDAGSTSPSGDAPTVSQAKPRRGARPAKAPKPQASAEAATQGADPATVRGETPKAAPASAPAFDFARVATCRIHPGIGIARVGNSPDEFFIGPEAPCDPSDIKQPAGGYKDVHGRVKRQAARFRIYAYDGAGNNLGELPIAAASSAGAPAAQIVWQAHLANRKGAWFKFVSRFDFADEAKRVPRNLAVPIPPGGTLEDRGELVIDPGPRCISGLGEPVDCGTRSGAAPSRTFDTGTFRGTPVPLGELQTDDAGRLLVLGGYGKSGSTEPNNPIGASERDEDDDYYANNDNWYDDISDGPVTATITLPDGKVIRCDSARDAAWVIVAPPKYAPGIHPIVTLYDVIRDTAVKANWLTDPAEVNYHRDILPILLRASDTAWVNNVARRGHSTKKLGDYRTWKDGQKLDIDRELLNSSALSSPAPNGSDPAAIRKRIFERLRNPTADEATAVEQATARFMPYLSGDEGRTTEGYPTTWLSLLPSQYKRFERWKDGDFEEGSPATFPDLSDIADPDMQTQVLQRAALEPCAGGAFLPGIEMTYVATHKELYDGAFRINARKYKAGDISKWMALPWQADFYLCRGNWWPSQRPDDVIPEEVFEAENKAWRQGKEAVKVAEGLEGRVRWDRGLGVSTLLRRPWQNPAPAIPPTEDLTDSSRRGCDDMVRYWSELGFVVPRETASGKAAGRREIVHVETQRRPYAGMDIRELFHSLLNLEGNIGALPKVNEFVESVLQAARDVQQTAEAFNFMENIRPFNYDEQLFDARMQDIYDDCADFAFANGPDGKHEAYDAENKVHNPYFRTREQVIERIKQLTPFNFLDGAWLRNVHRLGPMDEVNSILFAIFNEELGDGVPSQNHANIYRDLCHSFGFYPPPVGSTAFAHSKDFLDSAFESATFQLGIAEFTERYYPEILGMTLWLEWTVLELHRIAAIVERVGLSSHFYRMHIAIDNAANGHAAGILRAIKIYLHQVRQEGGEPAVQCQWQRIWDGYVAFGYTFVVLIEQVKWLVNDKDQETSHEPGQRRKHLEKRLRQLIVDKKIYGQHNHTRKMLGRRGINEWFDDPRGFLDALRHGEHKEPGKAPRPYIVPGKPEESAFFDLLEFQGGVMYRVFSDEEIKLWRDWVWELGRAAPASRAQSESLDGAAASTRAAAPGQPQTQAAALQGVASQRRLDLWAHIAETGDAANGLQAAALEASARAAGHDAANRRAAAVDTRLKEWLGWGMIRAVTHMAMRPSEDVSADPTIHADPATGDGRTTAEWLDLIRSSPNPALPARAFLAALACSVQTAARSAAESVPTAFTGTARVVVPGNDGRSMQDTLRAWIEHGCPLPTVPDERAKPLRLDATLDEEEHHPTGIPIGFGTIH